MGGLFKHFDCWSWRHLLCPPIDLSWPMTWAPKQNSFPRLSRSLTQMSHFFPFLFYQVKDDGNSTSDKRKGRTGWPHHVWALELKPWNNIITTFRVHYFASSLVLMACKTSTASMFSESNNRWKKKSDKKKWILFKIWICSSVSPVHFCGRCNTQDDGWKWNSLSMNRRHTLWPVQIGLREI